MGYFIGSVHYVSDSWAIDDPSALSKWQGRDPFEIWSIYFDWLTRAADTRLFHIIGHADLPKKFGVHSQTGLHAVVRAHACGGETSGNRHRTQHAGLRKQCKEIYPSPSFLALAQAAQVPITFGSDAHAPEEVGADFPAAVQLAHSCGYTHSLQFSAGQSASVPLPGV